MGMEVISVAFLTYYFTNAGVTGRTGGTQAQFDSAYSNSLLKGQVKIYSGIQEWVVPLAGTYQLEAWGAQGSGGNGNNTSGGRGAYVKSEVFLNTGDVIYILVGQAGTYNGASVSDGSGGGGGGASTIARKVDSGGYNMTVTGLSGTKVEPLIVAAGGGARMTADTVAPSMVQRV